MREVAIQPRQEEVFVKFYPALWLGVDLDHPALDPLGIELSIDSTVERVGEVDATSIATDLYRQCHGNSDSSAVRRRLASSDETDIV